MIIKKVKAKKIKNSRGEDTIKVIIKSDIGKGEGSAPSGMSKGKHEVMAFPEEGVEFCVKFINNELKDKLIDLEIKTFEDLKKIEDLIDKKKYGGNTVLAVEYAIIHASGMAWKFINEKSNQVPRPVGNVIGGGAHTRDKKAPDFQEFLALSLKCDDFGEAVSANFKLHDLVRKKLKEVDSEFNRETSDEGAWIADITNTTALDILYEKTKEVSEEFGFIINLGLDIAASNFYKDGKYHYKNHSDDVKNKVLSSDEQIEFIGSLIEKYELKYVEDPLDEEDFEGFAKLREKYGSTCLIVGDDLITTNSERLEKAIKEKSVNAVIIKPNQIGGLIETKKVIDKAKENKIFCIISHRSGETKDVTISHLTVAFNIPLIKAGIYGSEREVKLKEVKKIEGQIKLKKFE
jgi:enolase